MQNQRSISHFPACERNGKKYLGKLLEWIIEDVKFLAKQRISFYSSVKTVGSSFYGNYLRLLDLLTKFDPFSRRVYSCAKWFTNQFESSIQDHSVSVYKHRLKN